MTKDASSAKLILDAEQIRRKITRIAYEIYERNFDEEQLLVAGVVERGYRLAERICAVLDRDSTFTFASQKLQLVRVHPPSSSGTASSVTIDCDEEVFRGKSVVLIDDVMNTGRTLAHCACPFLQYAIRKLEAAVLVNRSHVRFPVSVGYTGYALATTLHEHIEVVLDDKDQAVYLK
ncbi:MAG: phosphoribosyltransferase family protein [Tunicatimonas sp.]